MKLSVIALDYDGTIAQHDRLSSAVRDAIAAARTRGILVRLVTGRILSELRRGRRLTHAGVHPGAGTARPGRQVRLLKSTRIGRNSPQTAVEIVLVRPLHV
jgi:hypothetical protein